MAKIRIYELARELNMTNNQLLEKLEEMEIAVSSHMGSVDSELINAIKARILGKEVEEMEVTRVKPTVIRRRRKKAVTQPIQPEEGLKPESVEAEEEQKSAVVGKEEGEEKPVTETSEKAEKLAEEVSETIPTDTGDEEKALGETPDEKAKPKLEVVKPKKAKKKKPQEKPAKIIRLPSADQEKKPAVKTVSRKKVSEKKPSKKAEAAARPSKDVLKFKKPEVEEVARKGKKVKKKEEDDFKDRKFFKKKISFRRKEIVEGTDLYSKRQRTRKGRKGAKGRALFKGEKTQLTTPKAIKRRIKIDDTINLADLAHRMGIKAAELIKTLMSLGVMATVNQTVGFETAALVASEMSVPRFGPRMVRAAEPEPFVSFP